jgi:gamma-glutamylcysteine synthetase
MTSLLSLEILHVGVDPRWLGDNRCINAEGRAEVSP